jgi:hypothetical protein
MHRTRSYNKGTYHTSTDEETDDQSEIIVSVRWGVGGAEWGNFNGNVMLLEHCINFWPFWNHDVVNYMETSS